MKLNRLSQTLAAALVLAAGALTLNPQQAQAQNAVDVDIILSGGITILNYVSAIDVTINAAELAELSDPSCAAGAGTSNCAAAAFSATATLGGAAGGDLGIDANLDVAGSAADLSAVTLDLNNVWAVRALGGTTSNTTVAVALGSDLILSNGGSNNIDITDVQVFSGGAPAASVTFADPGLNPASAVRGGVRLTLDFTDANATGTYSAGTPSADENYTIQITST